MPINLAARTLGDLLNILETLRDAGYSMDQLWWGYDDGSLNTPELSIGSYYYKDDVDA